MEFSLWRWINQVTGYETAKTVAEVCQDTQELRLATHREISSLWEYMDKADARCITVQKACEVTFEVISTDMSDIGERLDIHSKNIAELFETTNESERKSNAACDMATAAIEKHSDIEDRLAATNDVLSKVDMRQAGTASVAARAMSRLDTFNNAFDVFIDQQRSAIQGLENRLYQQNRVIDSIIAQFPSVHKMAKASASPRRKTALSATTPKPKKK